MAGIKTGLAIISAYFLVQTPFKTITGNVVAVHQGDTFTIQSVPPNTKLYKIRLSNIDTPEIRQPFGLQAKGFTTNRILGKEIQVEYNMVDFYGRLIGSVVLPQGDVLNEELVRAGLAWHYRVIPSPSGLLERLQYEAWRRKAGIWVESSPIPPWEFRREKVLPVTPVDESQVDYDLILSYGIIGDPKKRIYWWPACKSYPEKGEKYVVFGYKGLAESMGYHSSSGCDQ
jgi:endonuclease YncB( thermonuclease family)